jgi:adenylate cyclase
VEIHASVLADLLDRRALHAPEEGVGTVLIFALAFLMGWITTQVRPLFGALAAVALLVGYDVLAYGLFKTHRIVLEMVPQNLTVLLCFSGVLVLRLMTEERERGALRERMGAYLPAHIVEELASRPAEESLLRGERREITALFCDIRDFTAVSERMSSGDTVALLNRFFTAMDEVVWRHEGLLDNHMGDCVMAFFGAPHDQPDHAERAVLAAIEMAEWVHAMADEWSKLGYKGLDVGIGVCTGEATIGNVGSDRRMHYTAVGDNVNVASRLEQLTRGFQVTILASESTRDAAHRVAEFVEVGRVPIRGVAADVTVYEVRGRRPFARQGGQPDAA